MTNTTATTTPTAMTSEAFDAALAALHWKGSDFCARAGLVPNTVWRWRKGATPIPLWVGQYLGAMQAIAALHAAFVLPTKRANPAPDEADEAADSDGPQSP